jgi:hypothetical protein
VFDNMMNSWSRFSSEPRFAIWSYLFAKIRYFLDPLSRLVLSYKIRLYLHPSLGPGTSDHLVLRDYSLVVEPSPFKALGC